MQANFPFVRMLVILKPAACRSVWLVFWIIVVLLPLSWRCVPLSWILGALRWYLWSGFRWRTWCSPLALLPCISLGWWLGWVKNPLWCVTFFVLGSFLLGIQDFPIMSSAPLTSSQFRGKFSIWTLFSTIFTRCLWLVKSILYCSLCASEALVYFWWEYLDLLCYKLFRITVPCPAAIPEWNIPLSHWFKNMTSPLGKYTRNLLSPVMA